MEPKEEEEKKETFSERKEKGGEREKGKEE